MTIILRKGCSGKDNLTQASWNSLYFVTLWIRQPVIDPPFPNILFYYGLLWWISQFTMVYYSKYYVLLWFTTVNTTYYYGLLWFIAQFTMVYYSKYYILLWFTIVNTTFYYGLLQWIPYFTMVYNIIYYGLL